jgi:hypothetical protein
MIELETRPASTPAARAGEESQTLEDFREKRERLAALIEQVGELPAAASAVFSAGAQGVLTVRDFNRDLARKIRCDTFKVAVIGEFSTGKSSLLNVLLGLQDEHKKKTEGFLPTAVVPTTAVITTLYYRPEMHIEAVLKDGTRFEPGLGDINAFLSQPGLWSRLCSGLADRKRQEQIAAELSEVKVGCPAPLLGQGVDILDTPGLGAVYVEHGEITRRCVATVDAALVLMSVSPPMGERDVTFLQYVANFTDRFVFVQNKRDIGIHITRGEPDWWHREQHHRQCIEKVLQRKDYPFFHVSALQAANARRRNDPEQWEASGIPELQRFLETFLVSLRGAPRLQEWGRLARRALELVRAHLKNEATALEGRLKAIEVARPSEADYEQWGMVREALDGTLEQLIDTTRNGSIVRADAAEAQIVPVLAEARQRKISVVQQAVRVEMGPTLSSLPAEKVRTDPDEVSRIEREVVRAIQRHVGRELQPLRDRACKEAIEAARQALGDRMPAALRRYQPVDTESLLEHLTVALQGSAMVEATLVNRPRNARGFWEHLASWFGSKYTETVTEYHLNREYIESAIDKSVQEAVTIALESIGQSVERLRQATLEEVTRIEESARQASEQEERIWKQSRAECETRLEEVRAQLAQLDQHAAEIELWVKL